MGGADRYSVLAFLCRERPWALGHLPVQDTNEQQKYVTLFLPVCFDDFPLGHRERLSA